MKIIRFLCTVCILFLLCGCQKMAQPQNVSGGLVRSISITTRSCTGIHHRYYSSPEKMRQILYYIRGLEPMFDTAASPAGHCGRMVCIQMICADGSSKWYRQKDDQYFQSGSGSWKRMAGGKGGQLWQLLLRLPNDEVPQKFSASPLPRPAGYESYNPTLRHLKIPDK